LQQVRSAQELRKKGSQLLDTARYSGIIALMDEHPRNKGDPHADSEEDAGDWTPDMVEQFEREASRHNRPRGSDGLVKLEHLSGYLKSLYAKWLDSAAGVRQYLSGDDKDSNDI